MENIVIIGGGFGGVYTALYLLKYFRNKRIILINKKNYFLFTPLLHEVATGAQNRHNIVLEIREILKQKNFEFCKGTVEKIDFNNKIVEYNNIKINYNTIIIAIGSKANLSNVPGAEKYAIPLKTIQDSINIRNCIIRSLEEANTPVSHNEFEALTTFVIIGGGPTGVELVGELIEFLDELCKVYPIKIKENIKIYLIHKGSEVIPQLMHKKCRIIALNVLKKKGINVLLNSKVSEVKKDSVLINDNIKILTKNIFWTGGVAPNVIETMPKLTNNGFYNVNEFFEVIGAKDVYALGDCALNFNPGSYKPNPLLAQLAVKQAKHLAKNIYLKYNNKKEIPFVFKPSGFLVSIGKWWAIAEIKGFLFKGRIAWWLWRTIYLSKIIGIKNKIRVGIEWFLLLFSKRDGSEI